MVGPKNPETSVFCCLPGILYKLVHECGPSMHCFADTAKWRGRKQRLYIVGWSWAAAYKLTSLFNLQVEYDEFNSLSVLGTGGDPVVIPLPNADIPLQVFNIY